MTLQEFQNRFSSNDICLEYLYELLYQNPKCPKCDRVGRKSFHKHPTKHCYTCNCGQHQIYPKKNTIFENSPISLSKWFTALYIFMSPKKSTAKDIERKLEVTYPTAWRMSKRINGVLQDLEYSKHPVSFQEVIQHCTKK